mmetsp:Transcript_5126/g.14694  ORF Transcript_5126/g.14694 Transcript_5126/m.14694 type:complete len:252 (-) Transcript_5126:407-1162(-)
MLVLLRELLFHVFLQATQQKWPQDRMKPSDDGLVVLGRSLDHAGERVGEPVLELGVGRKHLRHKKMHQRPQFHEIVLERRSSDQQAPLRVEVEERLPPLRLPVLDHVRLVQDEIFPFLAPKHPCILKNERVRRDAHVERVRLGPALALLRSLLGRAVIGEQLERRTPSFKLHLPVEHHRSWHDDQMRAPVAALARQPRQERDCLDGLAETHLVRQDTVQMLVVQGHQPVQTNVLILTQLSLEQKWHRGLHL